MCPISNVSVEGRGFFFFFCWSVFRNGRSRLREIGQRRQCNRKGKEKKRKKKTVAARVIRERDCGVPSGVSTFSDFHAIRKGREPYP